MHAPFTAAGLRRGIRDGLPLGVSIFLYGLAFGLVAAELAFTMTQALSVSATVYSGSAQLAAANLIRSGHVTLAALAATVLLVNARYILFSASLQPWLSKAAPGKALPSLLLLGDANWMVTMRAIEKGEQDRAYLAGTGLPMFAGWMAGTALGMLSGGLIPDPRALAADLMLPAFAAAMVAAMLKARVPGLPALVGAVVALGVGRVAGMGWATVAAGLAGAATAALRVPR